MTTKRFFALPAVAALLALLVTAGSALAAETTLPSIADTYVIDDVTYYNVNSQNFDSSKKFYEDVFNAKHSSLGDRSLGELWMLAAVGVGKGTAFISDSFGMDELLDAAKEAALNGYGAGGIQKLDDYQYSFTAPKWNNYGWVETTLMIEGGDTNFYQFRILFSDFHVGVLLPGDTTHYVSTTSENDNVKGEQASSTKNDSSNTVTVGQSVSKTVTESLASTITHSSSYSFTEGVKVGFETEEKAGVAAFKLSSEFSFSATQTISDGWSKSESKSTTNTVSDTINVTLPPYTTAMTKQGEADTTVTTKYNCPVFLSYKVEIYYESGGAVEQPFGPNAREDLQKRALVDVDYDEAGINWRTVLADKDYKDAVEKIASHAPMSPTGATMVYKDHTVYNDLSGIAPLYPLSYVTLGAPDINYLNIGFIKNNVATMHVGDYSYTQYLPLAGYNDRDAPYYGFNPSAGHWTVVGDDGKTPLPAASTPLLIEDTPVKGYMKFKAVRPGHCYMIYVIDEDAYPSGLGSNSYTKNSDLSKTAMLEVNVLEPEVTYEIDGDYKGYVNAAAESIEGDGKAPYRDPHQQRTGESRQVHMGGAGERQRPGRDAHRGRSGVLHVRRRLPCAGQEREGGRRRALLRLAHDPGER